MKFRNGFVSNSSSSSFIVIGDKEEVDIYPNEYNWFNIGDNGETEFGWGPKIIRNPWARINFAYLQSQRIENKEWKEMLFEVLSEKLGVPQNQINVTLSEEYSALDSNDVKWGYIDHQSSSVEGKNTEMFEDKETLRRFLFACDSEIVLDNDNR